nr:MAG TPA: hypothetical protein [Caudoviricetes sp.]
MRFCFFFFLAFNEQMLSYNRVVDCRVHYYT